MKQQLGGFMHYLGDNVAGMKKVRIERVAPTGNAAVALKITIIGGNKNKCAVIIHDKLPRFLGMERSQIELQGPDLVEVPNMQNEWVVIRFNHRRKRWTK